MADEYDCWAGTNQIMSEVQKKLQAMKEDNERLRKENQELRQEICLLRQDLIDLRNQHALGIITKPGVEMVVKDVTRTITPASCRYDEAMKVVK